jgi:HAD superfamily hydrolase (TIGR01509 family)
MIKAVIFDLDGVIVDLKTAHYETLNKALFEIDKNYVISISEHLNKFDGLPTVSKLKILHNEKGLPEKYFKDISKKKQEYTLDYILENVVKSDEISELFIKLKENEIKIIVCSNSVTNTIYAVLLKMNLLKYVDKIFSNENVVFKKPHPEIYFNGISFFGFLPKECLIVEDSPFGIKAANNSGAYVMSVKNSKELNSKKIMSKINNINSESFNEGKWHSDNMNIVIPMAGMGSRFKQNGYKLPKPLIDVNGKPMIQRVVENLNIEAKFIVHEKGVYRQKSGLHVGTGRGVHGGPTHRGDSLDDCVQGV